MAGTLNLTFLTPVIKSSVKNARIETKISVDNKKGLEDLVDLRITYVEYGTAKISTKTLTKCVKRGKSAQFKLPLGTNPAAFYLLWKVGDIYRWFGDGKAEDHIFSDIDAYWGFQEFEGMNIWQGGYTALATKP